ncbi:Band 4.1-like protein 5 [Holothuria leucospilota]|uniref:Band 4.1-like protein 5 n=1 Tax=Holothuria leucospilota TaxID=206669 RepID=A0A9Q1BEA0_HOLLE|nr:Band 4.1-like protein 5 [Holothuria leucospilota]
MRVVIEVEILKKEKAHDLLEQVYYTLDIIEKDYFGLSYIDADRVQHWLDPTKTLKKQMKPWKYYLGGSEYYLGGSEYYLGGSEYYLGGSEYYLGGSEYYLGGSEYYLGGSEYYLGGSEYYLGGSEYYLGGSEYYLGGSEYYLGGKPPPYKFTFRVKFYSSEPNNLHEEITRYIFFLQLKKDILDGRLVPPYDTSVELAALSLQSELGDYDPEEHTPELVSEFRFTPDQTEAMEVDIVEKFKEMK